MKVLVEDIVGEIDENRLRQALSTLPSARLELALHFRFPAGQYQSAAAWNLLARALREEYGITEAPALTYSEQGKPFFRDYPDIHFNLSHCRRGVACIVDNQPVGIDIEEIGRGTESLAHYVLNDEEIQVFQDAENPQIAFTKFWTMKESYLKLTGEGLTNELKTVLTPEVMKNTTITTKICPEKGYVYSWARKK